MYFASLNSIRCCLHSCEPFSLEISSVRSNWQGKHNSFALHCGLFCLSDKCVGSLASKQAAAVLAAVPTHVSIRLREVVERRSDLAKLDRTELSLRNSTIANLDWMVRSSIAWLVSQPVGRNHVRYRTRCSVSNICAAPSQNRGLHCPGFTSTHYHGDRQLLFLQFADHRPLPGSAGRRRVIDLLAAQMASSISATEHRRDCRCS